MKFRFIKNQRFGKHAFIFTQQGNISKALATIERGLKATPNDLLLNYNKAMILYQNGRKTEAIAQLQHALQIAPNDAKIQTKLNEWLTTDK